jgi:hypothetical protein
MIVPLISIVWLAVLMALVLRLAIRPAHTASTPERRSPALLESERASFEAAIGEVLRATPAAASSSKPAAAEHVRDGAQEDLYVRP